MPKYEKLREEAVKNKVAQDYFSSYEHTDIIGNIDFCIAKKVFDKNGNGNLFVEHDEINSLLWAEAKRGVIPDINESFVQLILTIGKAKTFNSYIPPYFLGAFDAEKIAFIPYHSVVHVFSQNDFNWNVTPSNHGTKEFLQLYNLVKEILDSDTLLFNFEENDSELKEFIKSNFVGSINKVSKIPIDKNNFTYIYQKWSQIVKPTINANWELLNKAGIISADFFLADLLSDNNKTLKDKLFVLLNEKNYEIDRKIDEFGFEQSKKVHFTDGQKTHAKFWNIYERPPKEEYWNYIVGRRDLLVPQDVRERKGSFFTPQIWVEKSQQYLADVLGEDWQDEYFIWDCCAGTGNLLNGLTNYHNVWASTLDKADVDVMVDRIENGGWKMFENHVFQFDFLNDDFSKCPQELQKIINDEEKRKKLVIYINPPYAEHGNAKQILNKDEKNKSKVATETKIYKQYKNLIGTAARELFAQFFIRIYKEIPSCIIGEFSTLKHLQAPNFSKFRNVFTPKLKSLFIIPSFTFDNVKGKFPIGFHIWDLKETEKFNSLEADVFNENGIFKFKKIICSYLNDKYVIDWLRLFHDKTNPNFVGYLRMCGTDMQHNKDIFICNKLSENDIKECLFTPITSKNLIQTVLYNTIRHVKEKVWFEDRDQFLYPNSKWEVDRVFQSNSLIFTLFDDSNNIKSEFGTNHWIPFTEEQVGSKKAFKSNFMSNFIKDFLAGKISIEQNEQSLSFNFDSEKSASCKIELSPQAQAVFDSGLELWKYYHSKINANPDASFYDIRKYFQGETNGRMNNDSNDEHYMELISDLRSKMKTLAKAIEPKIYEYGFLK